MGKLLITGASGYIGGKLAKYYLEEGTDVRLLLRRPDRLPSNLKERCSWVQGDITQPETLPAAVEKVEAVISAAGLLGNWGLPYQKLFEVNVTGALNLIQAAFNAGVCRFIHLSAGGVTGPLCKDLANETYSPAPVTDYERTKWEGEKRALEEALKENLNLLVVRPTFTYGPGDPHKLNLFRAVKKGRFAYIGNGYSTVHPVYIDDLVVGIDSALKSNLKQTSIIIGGPAPVTKRQLVEGIANALGVRKPTLFVPVFMAEILANVCELTAGILRFNPPLTKSRVLALSKNWGYDIRKAREELGYQPQIDLQEGLRRTVSWYQERGWL